MSDVREAIGPDLGTWTYDPGVYECQFRASTEDEDYAAQFLILHRDDDWWATVSAPPHGEFELDRKEFVSADLMLAWPGPTRADQGMCDLAVPGEHWLIDFSGSGRGGACEFLLDAYDDLGERNR